MIEHLSGVKAICNRMEIGPVTVSDALEVRDAIRLALERQAAGRAKHIHVDVRDGVVTLMGKVRSPAEKDAVYQSICHTFQARSVENRLQVDSDL